MTTSHPAIQLLEALFSKAPADQYLEIRPMAPKGGALPRSRKFLPLRQLQHKGFADAVPEQLDGQANVYFGVCSRYRSGGSDC